MKGVAVGGLVLVLLACAGSRSAPVTPPPEPETPAAPQARAPSEPAAPAAEGFSRLLNGTHDGARVFKATDGVCVTRGEPPPPRFPGHVPAPVTHPVPCPDHMTDDSWSSCLGGTVMATADLSRCRCTVPAHPPVPPKLIDCPTAPEG